MKENHLTLTLLMYNEENPSYETINLTFKQKSLKS